MHFQIPQKVLCEQLASESIFFKTKLELWFSEGAEHQNQNMIDVSHVSSTLLP